MSYTLQKSTAISASFLLKTNSVFPGRFKCASHGEILVPRAVSARQADDRGVNIFTVSLLHKLVTSFFSWAIFCIGRRTFDCGNRNLHGMPLRNQPPRLSSFSMDVDILAWFVSDLAAIRRTCAQIMATAERFGTGLDVPSVCCSKSML